MKKSKAVPIIKDEEIPGLVRELWKQLPDGFFDDVLKAIVPINEYFSVEIHAQLF